VKAPSKKVAIVGAGISGLSSAYFLSKFGCQVEVFERRPTSGGLISTIETPKGLVETAANAFVDTELLQEISRDIGVRLHSALRESKRRYIYVDKKAQRWPLSLWETLKMIFILPLVKNKKPLAGETLSEWAIRALGAAVSLKLIAPAIQGIYAGSSERLSASLVLSRLFDKSRKKSAVKRQSVAPKKGMGEWIKGMEAFLKKSGVVLHFGQAMDSENLLRLQKDFDVVLIASSASCAASLLNKQFPCESRALLNVSEMLPLTSVTTFCETDPKQIHGFGVLFAREEGITPLGVLFNSDIFENRSSLRSETWIFSGVNHSKDSLESWIKESQRALYGKELVFRDLRVQTWPQALPYYSVELEKYLRESSFQSKFKQKKVYLVGNYLGRIGLSDLLEKSREVAKEIV